MRHKTTATMAASLVLTMLATAPLHAQAPVDDPDGTYHALPLRAVGRVTADGRSQWPGVYYEGTFSGFEVDFTVNDPRHGYNIYVDGQRLQHYASPPEVIRVRAMEDNKHVIRLERTGETMDLPVGPVTARVRMDDGGSYYAPPKPPARQIEVIGDSYAAGYGTTSTKRLCSVDEIRTTTDTQQAFGPLLAKHYDADYQINAVSGIGMVRNYDDASGDVMPALYPYTLFDKQEAYRDPSWNPQIVVIALGDNDFATPVKTGGKWADDDALTADFISTYVKFVEDARKAHPRATFILMDYGEPALIPAIARIAERLRADGETRILTWSAGTGLEQTGCDWHLSLNDHRRISDGLIRFIDRQADIWQASH